jgi:hypothetical protein
MDVMNLTQADLVSAEVSEADSKLLVQLAWPGSLNVA